jgi:hypothetical protein
MSEREEYGSGWGYCDNCGFRRPDSELEKMRLVTPDDGKTVLKHMSKCKDNCEMKPPAADDPFTEPVK